MYEDRYVRRGEIYAIKSGSFNEPDSSMSRPGLIISSKTMNDLANAVIVAMLTTTENNIGIHYGPIMNTGRKSYVCCERLLTVDKARIGRMMGELSENQMKEVESRLDDVLDLGYVDDTPLKEKEAEVAAQNIRIKELQEEIAELKKQIASHADDVLSNRAEIEMWQRLYEKALDQVCVLKLNGDIARKTPVTTVEKTPKETVKSQPVVEDEPKLLDINTAKFDDFRKIGLSSNLILTIINKRPYKSVTDLKGLPGMTSIKYNLIEKKVCCTQSKKDVECEQTTEKVNINTATGREIKEKLGINECYAYSITSHRNKKGPFTSLEELKEVKGLSSVFYDTYKDRLTVGDNIIPAPPVVEQSEPSKKVNVNTVKTAAELGRLTGMCSRTTGDILRYRKAHGNFTRLEDLLNVPSFGSIAMKRYGHLLEV